MVELWKDIKDYEGLYEVSNCGRVRSLQSGKIRVLSLHRGYLVVNLYVNYTCKKYRVHQLVAQAFLEKPNLPYQLQINHKDSDRSNNKQSNLEWVSLHENKQRQCEFDGIRQLRGKNWQARITIEHQSYHIGTYATAVEAAKARDKFVIDRGYNHTHGIRLNFPIGG